MATVGGWQLAVSKYSKNPDASIEFVRYMTSKAVNKFDTITNSNVPTYPSLANDPQVKKVAPYLNPATALVPRATRPSNVLGPKYNEGSKAIYQAINRILNGASAKSVLPGLQPSSSGSCASTQHAESKRGRMASVILPRPLRWHQ